MTILTDNEIPKEAIQAFKAAKELFGSSIIGVYLTGSAVHGGFYLWRVAA
jgi:streptomycin 3"-adenylyltransferase